jgi:hypothetical protein
MLERDRQIDRNRQTDKQKPNETNDRLTQKCKYTDRQADCDMKRCSKTYRKANRHDAQIQTHRQADR